MTVKVFRTLDPLLARVGYDRVERLILPLERGTKRLVFDCRMCGQCILYHTGMTCPMTCPKQLRNGPCGGVRPGGYCEVYPERRCVWTDGYEEVGMMRPFSDFSYLRQAFTRGERWPIEAERMERLTVSGLIDADKAALFSEKGAIGSHLENIQRGEGFKGFNQTTISDIIRRTDPRRE